MVRIVKAKSVEDYLRQYYKKDRMTPTLIASYQEEFEKNGYVCTSHHDNVTGEFIVWPFYPPNNPMNSYYTRPGSPGQKGKTMNSVMYDKAALRMAEEIKTKIKTEEQTWDEQAEELGRNAMENIAEMVAALEVDYGRLEELRVWVLDDSAFFPNPAEKREIRKLLMAAGDCTSEDEARERIADDPLSVQVRSGWTSPGEEMEAEEFTILLVTGGPAVRIMGELDENMEPCRAWLEVQDWCKPWTQYYEADVGILLTYCRCFFFGA